MVKWWSVARVQVIIFAIFVGVVLFFSPPLSTHNIAHAVLLPSEITQHMNKERESRNLPPLAVNSVLNDAAEAKARDMASKGYFAHTSPEGKTPWYWFGEAGYEYQYAGENLAIKFTKSENLIRAWMQSPTHRANIIKETYTEVGTGIATGFYEGKEVIFVAQLYGNPSQKSVVKNPPVAPKIPAKITAYAPKKVQTQAVKKPKPEVLGVEASVISAGPSCDAGSYFSYAQS